MSIFKLNNKLSECDNKQIINSVQGTFKSFNSQIINPNDYIIFEKGYWTYTKKDEITKFYKNAESWAKRVSQLNRKGF